MKLTCFYSLVPAFGLFLHSKFQKYALELMHFYTGEHFSLGVFMPKVGQHVDLDNVHQVVTCFDMSS